jgi:hypothetical protein
MTAAVVSYEIQGRHIELPLEIGDASAGIVVCSASLAAVAAALPPGLRPVRWRPGRGLVVLLLVSYRENPLGAYDEVVVASAARLDHQGDPRAGVADLLRGRVGVFVHEMPVSEAFTCEAGRVIWSYPKAVDDLDVVVEPRRATVTWRRAGEQVLRLAVRRGGRLRTPRVAGTTYTHRDGHVLRTGLSLRASGARLGVGGARLQVGDGQQAELLRALELGRPLASAWLERASLRFEPPRTVASGAS